MTVYNALTDDEAYKLIDGCLAEMEMPRRVQLQHQLPQQQQQQLGCGRRDNTDMDA